MFCWTEQSLDWYRRAAAHGDFHAQLAARLAPYLSPTDTVFDLGCGAGYLSLELAARTRQVTAVDIDQNALIGLRQMADAHGVNNLDLLCADCSTLAAHGITRDIAVLCFFGQLANEENLNRYLGCCTKTLVAIVSDGSASDISPSGVSRHGKHRTVDIEAFLHAQGIPFTLTRDTLEFGQPLDSLEEGEAFVRHYAPHCSVQEARAHLAAHCTALPDGRFYLPNQKHFGIFAIAKSAEYIRRKNEHAI